LEEGLNVKVIAFPDGEDPDSFASQKSAAELKEFLETEAVDFIKFKAKTLIEDTDRDPLKRAEMIRDIVNSIALIPDPIIRSVYVQESSNLLEIDEQTLVIELNKIRRSKLSKNIQKQENEKEERVSENLLLGQESDRKTDDTEEYQERDLIYTLIKYGNQDFSLLGEEENEGQEINVGEYLIDEVLHDQLEFKNPLYDRIFRLFVDRRQAGGQLKEQDLISHEDKTISSLAIESLLEKYELSLNWEEKHKILTITEAQQLPIKIHKGICSWRLKRVMDMILEKQEELRLDPDDYEKIQTIIKRLEEAKKALAAELGRIVLPK
jgi:DNA primase